MRPEVTNRTGWSHGHSSDPCCSYGREEKPRSEGKKPAQGHGLWPMPSSHMPLTLLCVHVLSISSQAAHHRTAHPWGPDTDYLPQGALPSTMELLPPPPAESSGSPSSWQHSRQGLELLKSLCLAPLPHPLLLRPGG